MNNVSPNEITTHQNLQNYAPSTKEYPKEPLTEEKVKQWIDVAVERLEERIQKRMDEGFLKLQKYIEERTLNRIV